MKQVDDLLENLGLSEPEIKIYLKLLELGRCSITELAHALSMNRVTAYFNIKNLVDMGLITHMKQGRNRELSAQSPEALKYLIEQKDRHIRHLKEQFDETYPILAGMVPASHTSDQHKFDVKFYQGMAGIRDIYGEALKAKELRSYVNIEKIYEIFPENAKLFRDAVYSRGVSMWEIIEDSVISRKDSAENDPKHYYYKFFPAGWKYSEIFDYMIFEGKIAMIAGENEANGILIINDNMYRNAKALFELLWQLLPEPKESHIEK